MVQISGTITLPKNLPVVLKKSGRKEAISRFHQMLDVRNVLEKQRSSHLTIPKARLFSEFLIEERLPINTDDFSNMDTYVNNLSLFDEPVRELTRLFSVIYLSDLVGPQPRLPINNLVGFCMRYDNLPSYIIRQDGKKIVKIGLIDLEHQKEGLDEESLLTLIKFFPYHKNIILEEAKKFDFIVDEKAIELAAKQGIEFLQRGYVDHAKWLEKKEITLDSAFQRFDLGPNRIKAIESSIYNELLKINEGKNDYLQEYGALSIPKDFFGNNPDVVARDLAPKISEAILTQLNESIDEELKKWNILEERQLVGLRSPVLDRKKLIQNASEHIAADSRLTLGYEDEKDIAEQILSIIMQELVKGDEIFSFDHGYSTKAYNFCWVRY